MNNLVLLIMIIMLVLLIVYKSLSGQAPKYIKEFTSTQSPVTQS